MRYGKPPVCAAIGCLISEVTNVILILAIPLIQSLTPAAFDRVLEDFAKACHEIDSHAARPTICSRNILEQLNVVHDSLVHDASANSTATLVAGIWSLHTQLEGHIDVKAVEIYLLRQTLMLSHSNLFIWLQSLVDECTRVFRDVEAQPWILQLFRRVFDTVSSMNSSKFDSSQYIPDLPYTSTYEYSPQGRSRYLTPDEAMEATRSVVFDIVRLWLRFPNDPALFHKAQLICVLREAFPNSVVLLLPEVWDAYCHPQRARTKSRDILSAKHFDHLRHDLGLLPCLNADHHDYIYHSHRLDELEFCESQFRALSVHRAEKHNRPHRHTTHISQTHSTPRSQPTPSSSSEQNVPLDPGTVNVQEPLVGMRLFRDFLVESARVADLDYEATSPLECTIAEDRDRRLAWREHAESR